jgi:hypothetical protein
LGTDAVASAFLLVRDVKMGVPACKGASMFYPFSKMMDYAVDTHFRKDRSGRLVFIPFTLKGKCYFVDSESDEEKIRPFVKMFRSAVQFISFLMYPSLFVPGLILDNYAGMSPREHRLAIAFGIPMFFALVLGALVWMLWSSYKGAIPSLTASLSEVGPDAKGQLRQVSQPSRRLPLLFAVASVLLMVLALFAFVISLDHFRR